mgnify:CR=1 FL=1
MTISENVVEFIQQLHKNGVSPKEIRRRTFDELGSNVSSRSVYYIIKRGKKSKQDDIKFKSDGSQTHTTIISMDEEQSKDPDFVLRAHGYNPDSWDLVQHVHNIWQQNSVEDGTKDLKQSKITVKPKMKTVTVEDLIAAMKGKITPVKLKHKNLGENTIVISLFDMHFGITKLSMLKSCLEQMLEIISRGHKRVVIIIGGDYSHSNFMNKTQTANNTQLDHVNTIKALNEGVEFLSQIIECAITNSSSVEVHAISGNHDLDHQYMLMWGMSQKYPQIKFDNNLNTRTAFSFGTVGILVAHGNLALKKLPLLFANEYPEIWSKSTYRMVASGHFHQEKLSDDFGVVMHQFGTPKPNDPYEYANGYTMSRRHLQVLEFNESRLLATYEIE